MGQYHTVAAFTDDQAGEIWTLQHYALGAGAKLTEQAYAWEPSGCNVPVTSPYMAAFALLMQNSWKNCRVAVIGDYADEDCDPFGWDRIFHIHEYYGDAEHNDLLTDCTDSTVKMVSEAFGYTFDSEDDMRWLEIHRPDDIASRVAAMQAMPEADDLVLVSTIGEYLDPRPLMTPGNRLASMLIGFLWPTAYIMLAVSDGRGGGDAGFQPAGRWAYTKIGFASRLDAERAGAEDITSWALRQQEIQWMMDRATSST